MLPRSKVRTGLALLIPCRIHPTEVHRGAGFGTPPLRRGAGALGNVGRRTEPSSARLRRAERVGFGE